MTLRVLHLEDDPNDRELVAETLHAERVECTILSVACREAYEAALENKPDLILADFSLPGFDGERAQVLARAKCPDVPFVFVTGSIGEEKAVERLKAGATDYVLKEHLEKLPTAVRRALREAEDRRARAAAEAALRKLNEELEARIEERTSALVEANRQLEAARQAADQASVAKSEFLSAMSHDLRTPLNAIMGFAQLLQLEDLTPVQADSVAQILRGGEHLLQLINEILDIARIEAGRLTLSPEPVAVSDVVSYCVSMIEPLAAQRGVSIKTHAPEGIYCRADRQRLIQVLLNLLSNAVKYNRHAGEVRVIAQRQLGVLVRIDVIDTGAGIPAAKRALLFKPFERLGAESSAIEGTGLGLALSKALVDAMEGSLQVESTEGQGTMLRVLLPMADAASAAEPHVSQVKTAVPDTAGTVVYIEDNAANAKLMQRVLERRPGVTLRHAPDAASGLELVRTARPDLVLLDLHIANVEGEEVLRHIWEDPQTRSIPVAVLSADASSASQRRLLASGAIRYLTKPFAIADILALVDDVLGRRM